MPSAFSTSMSWAKELVPAMYMSIISNAVNKECFFIFVHFSVIGYIVHKDSITCCRSMHYLFSTANIYIFFLICKKKSNKNWLFLIYYVSLQYGNQP